MKASLLLIIIYQAAALASPIIRQTRQASTTTSSTFEADDYDSDNFEQEDEEKIERAMSIAEHLPEPMTVGRTKLVLQRALDMLNRQPISSQCKRTDVEDDAKGVLRALTGDPTIGSASEDSQQASEHQIDEYCDDPFIIPNSSRRISLNTMKNIVERELLRKENQVKIPDVSLQQLIHSYE